MLRRPPTAIMLTVDDITAYEDRKAQAALNRATAARNSMAESSQGSKASLPDNKQSNHHAQALALMTPEPLPQQGNSNHTVDESMLVDTDEIDDSLVLQRNTQRQGSLFTPPNAPIRGAQAQARQRSRNERIGVNR